MPFTLSHPAAVLPLARGPLVPSALVIGSMAPDIPYFFFAMELRGATHRAHGVVTVDLLIGLAAFAVFHLVWKRPLAALAPAAVRRRLPMDAPVRWGWAVPSLVLGAATHVFWDAFTHLNWSFAGELPWLTRSFGGMAVYVWLQYVSGAAGLAIVLLWLARWLRTAPPAGDAAGAGSGPWRVPVCAGLGAVTAAGGLLSALLLPDERGVHTVLYYGAVGTIAAAGLALTAYAVWWHAARPAALEH
ncbi:MULTISPECIES: DUF4184 family protein [Actinomadura]|uniref:DUF4184 family protein n=1 Tax=Actinomadura TaxID=1988 RepID=UPI0003F7D2E7|nr:MULTISPECIES: DUF4184 family protein [Actinomadura]RSN67013.1 DUF4184 domain-containing protein [Actinomadura sp. WAC 06369]